MKRIASALLMSAVFSAPAFAAGEGGYIAIDLGQTTIGGSNNQSAVSTTTFPNPGAIVLGGGYRFNQNLGVEANYSMIGSSTINTTIVGVGSVSEVVKTSSMQVAAVGTYPINEQFDVFGKLGLASNKVDYTLTSNFGAAATANASKTGLMFALGGQYNINQQFGVRLQYTDLGKVTFAAPNAGDISLKVISVGGVYNF